MMRLSCEYSGDSRWFGLLILIGSLSMGGGPGSSGMLNALLYEAPCIIGPKGTTKPNKDRWTESFNLLALDHVSRRSWRNNA